MQSEKNERQKRIVEILDRETISNQEELRGRLYESGLTVTQATLSRDLKELGIAKRAGRDGVYRYTRQVRPIRTVLSLQYSGTLLVIKTEAGMAPVVAYRVDALGIPEVLGTVAGEDTLLVVLAEDCQRDTVAAEIQRRVG